MDPSFFFSTSTHFPVPNNVDPIWSTFGEATSKFKRDFQFFFFCKKKLASSSPHHRFFGATLKKKRTFFLRLTSGRLQDSLSLLIRSCPDFEISTWNNNSNNSNNSNNNNNNMEPRCPRTPRRRTVGGRRHLCDQSGDNGKPVGENIGPTSRTQWVGGLGGSTQPP